MFLYVILFSCKMSMGAQWLSGRVLDLRLKGRGLSLTDLTALWSLGKTHLS